VVLAEAISTISALRGRPSGFLRMFSLCEIWKSQAHWLKRKESDIASNPTVNRINSEANYLEE